MQLLGQEDLAAGQGLGLLAVLGEEGVGPQEQEVQGPLPHSLQLPGLLRRCLVCSLLLLLLLQLVLVLGLAGGLPR